MAPMPDVEPTRELSPTVGVCVRGSERAGTLEKDGEEPDRGRFERDGGLEALSRAHLSDGAAPSVRIGAAPRWEEFEG